MELHTFDDFLTAAQAQPEPQRLLLVFAEAGLPPGASAAQRRAFEAGEGGVLNLLMCVDKSPHDLASFAALAAEAREAGPPWTLMFTAALTGRGGRAPTEGEVQSALESLVKRIHSGQVEGLLPFDAQGRVVQWGAA
ncbi:ribonucleotide reductase subunit alpha [Inhella gelatinilytica]|uniref:Ribonucleotide reductase subunit alpha n=1 Tax=Inhella gelatinilytica TaxID=2795030 RepID=A0A931IZA4_9BURK|nr:ribonucleotide reductase subunit alpha [Inhella gelatinilytica]MBH9553755.1 ribonucleotide reductase subunit alpha [Inhella gelatinilytica]